MGLGECFFFKSLVVGLPYSLVFWKFWLFLFLNLLLSFFWLCEEAQCVYLHFHLGGKSYLDHFEGSVTVKFHMKQNCEEQTNVNQITEYLVYQSF